MNTIQVKTSTQGEAACTAVDLFSVLSGRWTLHVLYQLHTTPVPLRFGELRTRVGRVTQKELTKTLRLLESLGLVERKQFEEIPPRVEYCVTPLGASLREPITGLGNWLLEHGELREAMQRMAAKHDSL